MTTTAAERKLMTAAELLMMPRGVKRYELIRGALLEYPLTENLGGQAASGISFALSNWADKYDTGHAVISCVFGWIKTRILSAPATSLGLRLKTR